MLVTVIVKPGSKAPGISQENGALIVRVRERPVDGAANTACVRALARFYGVPPGAVELVAGARGRRKRFTIGVAKGANAAKG
jgi:uncharacterized protein